MYLHSKQSAEAMRWCRQQIVAQRQRPRTDRGAPRGVRSSTSTLAGTGAPRPRWHIGLSSIPSRLVDSIVCAIDMDCRGQSIPRTVESYHNHGGRLYLVSVLWYHIWRYRRKYKYGAIDRSGLYPSMSCGYDWLWTGAGVLVLLAAASALSMRVIQ